MISVRLGGGGTVIICAGCKNLTHWSDNVESLISTIVDVFQIRVELVQFLSQERSDSAEDPDVALQLEDGVVQLSAISLVQTLLILF